ncbi:MAG TPA: HAMP domain-containing sensor histidine kinase [Patescibacteria group bacterium]|nr:HAMP domain-containing sensor histidine kinase [Patescibacteria group bacterium]
MSDKTNFEQFNIVKQCRRYGFPLWQCPQFLFLVMGVIIIFSTIITYAVGTHYVEDPLIVAFIVLLVAIILLIISAIITRSFERLTEANRMKSEFVSIVSHQLRSPLSNLKWVTELLMSGRIAPVSEKQAEYFRILKENSEKMKELISDLLIVSRIEEGKFLLNKEKVSLVDLIRKTMKEIEIFVKASNIEMDFKAEDNLPEADIYSSQVKLAIGNLLDNAVRYTKERGKVEIRLKRKNRCLYFEIKDNGAGIPKEDQKYIFQKFFRSANAKKHQTEGSGLGLYIAKSIIEKSGGKINFKSQEGIGSTFWFTLPIK